MPQTQAAAQIQESINIERLMAIYAKVKRAEHLDKIFEDSDKAQELNFNDVQGEH